MNMSKIENIMLIGLGYHARRIYFPVLHELQQKKVIGKIFIVDLKNQEKVILDYLNKRKNCKYELFLLDRPENKKLSKATKRDLDNIVNKGKIKGVIISTEPLAHMVYARWALKNRLSILMDKPISTHMWISTNVKMGKKLISDYQELLHLYNEARKERPEIVFALMAQRRFHPVFNLIKSKIKEVYERTRCPITSIQAFHGDGQWRFPTEIIDQIYHPYCQGYGIVSHSGYHTIDIVSWFMEGCDKNPTEMEIISNFSTPKDLLAQYTFEDYRRDFPDFDKFNKYSEKVFFEKVKNYGEVDCFANVVFKRNGRVITLANINMSHNGYSQRNWVTAEGRDLYKGNGRIRHESYYILQGPFQAILYLSYQSKEVNPTISGDELFRFGGEYHGEVYIFRNDRFEPSWKCLEYYNMKDFVAYSMKDRSRGHQEEARRKAILLFIENLRNGSREIAKYSDLTQHKRTVKIMSGIYQSIAKRRNGLNPLVKMRI